MLSSAKKEEFERSQSQVKVKSSQSQVRVKVKVKSSQVKVKQGSLANVVWSLSSRVRGHIIFSYGGICFPAN